MKKINIITLLFSLLIIDCKIKDQTIKKDITEDIKYCDAAEYNLLKLNCKEGEPTKKGRTFYKFCQQLESNGIFLNAQCLSKINSCDQINECTGSE